MTGLEHDIKELKDHYDRQAHLYPAGTQKNIAYKKWYLQQLNLVSYKYKHLQGTAAQSARTALAIQRRSLERSLPGSFKGIRRFINQVWTALVGNKVEQRFIAQQTAGHQRVLYQLREAGLGKMIDQAEKCMKNGIPEFSLSASQEVARDKSFTAHVRFAKDDTGKYALNYKAQLNTKGKNGVNVRSLDNEENGLFTNERAISLLNDGAIKHNYFIQGEQHSEWLSLDFSDVNAQGAARIRRFDSALGYDLTTAFNVLTANGLLLQEPKEGIIRKLENGNQVDLLLDKDKGLWVRISADPIGKGFNFYDQQSKQISKEKALGKEKAQSNNIRIAVQRPNRTLKIH